MKETSTRLYRILSFHHVVQIFETNELHFSNPSVWEDPYETRITHNDINKVFAQCWCTKGVSDAMWRIYSPNNLGVRIGTSVKNLNHMLTKASKDNKLLLRMGSVEYLPQKEINRKAKSIKKELSNNFDINKFTDLLFVKREAYDHESEYRAVLVSSDDESRDSSKGIKIKINANELVDSLLIDPRAPVELSDALIYYFKEKIGFSKKLKRSVLYKIPRPLLVK